MTAGDPRYGKSGYYHSQEWQQLQSESGSNMSKHTVSFIDAELAGLAIRTAKNGKPYATGVLLLRNENGGFESSLPFICFSNAIGALRMLEQQEHSAELTGESGKPERPSASVSGWFKTTKRGEAWSTTFRLESVDDVYEPAEDSSL